jgi:hypothetical protein
MTREIVAKAVVTQRFHEKDAELVTEKTWKLLFRE